MKGERIGKRKTEFFGLTLPNRILSSTKVVKGERRQTKNGVFLFDYAEPHPISSYIVTFEISHSYKRLSVVYTIVYYLSCSILMNRIMQFVLYGSEKSFSHFAARVIIRSCGIYVSNLLIKITFTTTNVPNTLQ